MPEEKTIADITAPEYDENYDRWVRTKKLVDAKDVHELVMDLIPGDNNTMGRGEKTVLPGAAGDKAASQIYQKIGSDVVNDRFKKRAVYTNVVGATLEAMLGLAFIKPPDVEISPNLEALTDNADGSGLTLEQLAMETLGGVLTFGRVGLLVDYPREEADGYENHPLITYHPATSIRDWRMIRRGAKMVNSRIVVSRFDRADDLEGKVVETRLELALDDGGYYYQREWRNIEKKWIPGETVYPTDYNGNYFDEIPWQWVGSDTNSASVPTSPLRTIADINLGHLNSSALYEDSVYICGQPQPYVTGLPDHVREQLIGSGFRIGSGETLLLPEGCAFGIEQAKPNTLARESMEDKIKQMITLGARLLDPTKRVKTATEVESQDIQRNSALSLASQNVSEGVSRQLDVCDRFSTAAPNTANIFKIDRSYTISRPSADQIIQYSTAYLQGGIAIQDLYMFMVNGGVTKLDFEEWRAGLAQTSEMPNPQTLQPNTNQPNPAQLHDKSRPQPEPRS